MLRYLECNTSRRSVGQHPIALTLQPSRSARLSRACASVATSISAQSTGTAGPAVDRTSVIRPSLDLRANSMGSMGPSSRQTAGDRSARFRGSQIREPQPRQQILAVALQFDAGATVRSVSATLSFSNEFDAVAERIGKVAMRPPIERNLVGNDPDS